MSSPFSEVLFPIFEHIFSVPVVFVHHLGEGDKHHGEPFQRFSRLVQRHTAWLEDLPQKQGIIISIHQLQWSNLDKITGVTFVAVSKPEKDVAVFISI